MLYPLVFFSASSLCFDRVELCFECYVSPCKECRYILTLHFPKSLIFKKCFPTQMDLRPPLAKGGLNFQLRIAFSSARSPLPRKRYPLSHRNIICRDNAQWTLIIQRISYRNHSGKHHRPSSSLLKHYLQELSAKTLSPGTITWRELCQSQHYLEGTFFFLCSSNASCQTKLKF